MTQASADSRQTFSIINLGLGRWSAAQHLGPALRPSGEKLKFLKMDKNVSSNIVM